MNKSLLILGISYFGSTVAADKAENPSSDVYEAEPMIVEAQKKSFPKTDQATPSFEINKEAIEVINYTTVEDVFKYTPGLLIRKRYMGDPNGNLGMRGSNVFQTAHTSVYADGMPLHNPLQTSFNGAPRWSMVAPSEVDSAEVLYGPFSAQYGGASFGGVVNIDTRMPDKFEAHMEATGMFQDMHRAGRDELLTGYRTFLSAGDRFDKLSLWASYNRFENEGQPQTLNVAPLSSQAGGTAVTGGLSSFTPQGNSAVIYGDIGIAQTTTDLFKIKTAYDFTEDLQGRFTIAYEDRQGTVDDPNSLLRGANGNVLWGGGNSAGNSTNTNYRQFEQQFTVPGSAFNVSESQRQTLNYGLSLKGKVSDDWSIDTTASFYDAFKDRDIRSNLNPNHPNNRNKGQITDVNAWWAAYDLKLATDNFMGRDDLSFMGGYQLNHASLGIDVFNSDDYRVGSKDSQVSDSGGATQINSAFTQLEWRFIEDWSVMAGARFDHWQSLDGRVRNFSTNNIQNFSDRDASRVSPKASLEYSPDAWTFRYSFSKAYRFPIAQEMFASVSTLNNLNVSAPNLGPENGYFHNFMVQYDIPRGYVRANFFYDKINDEIASNVFTANNRTTNIFLPIDQTETIGVELTFQQNEIFDLPIDLMLNGTFMNKEIKKHNPIDPRISSFVNNEWDRIPRLLANATATYHIMPVWDAAVGVRYRSDSFQRLDNKDTQANVMGGTDESTFVDFKTTYHLPTYRDLKSNISAGIDNILDVDVFENHPYPQRTYFVKVAFDY
ncbi:TonB-dependent receptor [Methylicorpusculum sp.]|uniref:TonB-dependent receptor n=1 Tax=Methylicorpusculum sp. TaxID=2713644 RepID=UPI0027168A49|nr:TonB-dependent receptor [Methylicorpusculum sp.]MDO8843036.1 TonB-dependent receptor [Methylicorpusculum sp.]